MRSQPANAATSARRVERGRWKFVSSASATRKRWPGRMKSAAAPDVGRQRHLAHPLEPGEHGLVEREAEAPATVAERGDPLAPAARQVDALAGARRAAHEHLPLALLPEWCDEEELEAPAARPPPGYPSRDDTRVVHDQHVPGAQVAREVADVRVAERCTAAVEHEEARRRALGRRRLRDQRLGQRA